MKTAIFTTALFSLASLITASSPICDQEGNSYMLSNGTFPHCIFDWGGITSVAACQQLCLNQDGCYSYAYRHDQSQCHGYDNIVSLIGFTQNTISGYYFYDICCTI